MSQDDQTLPPRAPEPMGNALPIGTTIGEYRLDGIIGEGGFGIVYLAFDQNLRRKVALKEYMPKSFASRSPDGSIAVSAEKYRPTYEAGLRSFINEAHLLAQFDHPALVKVYRFWELGGTAYMVMPYYQGPTLRQRVTRMAELPSEAWLKSLLAPLIDALEGLHRENCYHRDIAPDNVLLLADDRPLLLDFGAARRIIGDMTQDLTVILKPGFAPVEQYGEGTSMRQGPWTDVYALAAVIYDVIAKKRPVPSVVRLVEDTLVPARTIGAQTYSQEFLAAIDAGLKVRPEDRPQDMAAFRSMLLGGAVSRAEPAPAASAVVPMKPVQRTDPASEPASMITLPMNPWKDEATVAPVAQAAAPPWRRRSWAMGLALLAMLCAGIYFSAPKWRAWLSPGANAPDPSAASNAGAWAMAALQNYEILCRDAADAARKDEGKRLAAQISDSAHMEEFERQARELRLDLSDKAEQYRQNILALAAFDDSAIAAALGRAAAGTPRALFVEAAQRDVRRLGADPAAFSTDAMAKECPAATDTP